MKFKQIILQSNRMKLVQLGPDGSFPGEKGKFYYYKRGELLRVEYFYDFLKTCTPFLFIQSRPANSQPKTPSKSTQWFIMQKNQKMVQGKLPFGAKIINGTFDIDGTWQADLKMDFNGNILMQVGFVSFQEKSDKVFFEVQHAGQPEWFIDQPHLELSGSETLLSTRSLSILGVSHFEGKTAVEEFEGLSSHGFNSVLFPSVCDLGAHRSSDELNELAQIVSSLEKQEKSASFVELALECTGINFKWILDAPNGFYNLKTCPGLFCVFEIDKALMKVNEDVQNGLIFSPNHPKEAKIDLLMRHISTEVLPRLKIEEYFLVNVAQQVEEFIVFYETTFPYAETLEGSYLDLDDEYNFMKDSKKVCLRNFLQSGNMQNFGEKRFGVRVNQKALAKYLLDSGKHYKREHIKAVLEIINEINAEHVANMIIEALVGLKEEITQKINEKSDASAANPLIQPYFIHLEDESLLYALSDGLIYTTSTIETIQKEKLHEEDPITSSNFFLLRRKFQPSDLSIRVRWGSGKSECRELWIRMRESVRQMARIFHGFLIKDFEMVPEYVLEYMINKVKLILKRLKPK